MTGITALELGNAAATLLILRATGLSSLAAATQLAVVLYVAYTWPRH
jgi:hypothetical protein